MNLLVLIFFVLVVFSKLNAAAGSHDDRPVTPPPSSSKVFSTPERNTMQAAITPSPDRTGKRHATETRIITAATIDTSDLIGAPRELITDLLLTQQRPFVVICTFSNEKDPRVTHILLTPTHPSEYAALSEINRIYQESIGTETADPYAFLSRNYLTDSEFSAKIIQLYRVYERIENDYTQPLFYTMPDGFYDSEKGTQCEPDFMSSITFSILGIVQKEDRKAIEILGDIWLSHIDDTEAVCLKGTSERSTMVRLPYQSMGIGQTAVSIFNEYLVESWHGKNAVLINSDSKEVTLSDLQFDGIMAFVEPSNFKSIGNNFRSRNFLVGAINIEGAIPDQNKPMLMFRAPSRICTPLHLAIDAVKQQETSSEHREKHNLFTLWNLVKKLYPSKSAIEEGVWIPLAESYAKDVSYQDYLQQTNELIKRFHGFSPVYSEKDVRGSPHFRNAHSHVFTETDFD